MIDPKKMIALWNTSEGNKITDFLILNIRDQKQVHTRLFASYGASDEGWMEGKDIDTPLGLYAFLASYYGFENQAAMFNVLREFQKVEGQDWTGDLLHRARDEYSEDV